MDVSKTFSSYDLVHNNDCHYNGRIWVLWKPNVISLRLFHKSDQHIHCSLLHIASHKCIEVTFIYAFNVRLDRRELWDQLQSISSQVFLPWLLVDHPATGCHFTWNNKQGDGVRWAKQDRILASPQWLTNIHSTAAFLNAGKLKKLRGYLWSIHTSSFTNLSDRVAYCKQALHQCQDKLSSSPMDPTLIDMENTLLQDYLMVKLADRRVRNSIGSIQDENGKLCTETKEVRVQEILDALKSIDRNKSPGINGYSSGIFLYAWNLVGHDFKAAVFEFFQTCTMPKAANLTLLKQVLDSIIGPAQAAFVANRDTFYNTILAHELVSKWLCISHSQMLVKG
ncbi:uncharacterized protein LOC141613537 [Silene latifolia]|uniref:uncharacterized protein LOC141613537 n=1 Tax=Silene latifolia TaxID=37657 RepID=UPI003D77C4D0